MLLLSVVHDFLLYMYLHRSIYSPCFLVSLPLFSLDAVPPDTCTALWLSTCVAGVVEKSLCVERRRTSPSCVEGAPSAETRSGGPLFRDFTAEIASWAIPEAKLRESSSRASFSLL